MSMYKDLLDFTIVAEDSTAIAAALTEIEDIVEAFTLSLPPEEAKRLLKIGMKTETFSYKALEVGKLHPGLLPRDLDLTRIDRDVAARETLMVHFIRIQRLHNLLQSTLAVLGADFYAGGRAIYRALKANGREAGLESVLAELGVAFARALKTTEPDEPAPTTTGNQS
ncbi:MAG: hypothetical protein EOP84_09805 [Verrucomicrobiaceae bacterium]|nr:MAG: hypothetical protein EOP84_09805 [Verrucomicrobiaceae bacterium]